MNVNQSINQCFNKSITNKWDWVICELWSCELRVASCELRVASCELRVASCELRVASCELRVASCELRVASCRFGSSTVLFDCVLKIVNWCWESIVSYFISF